MAEQEELNLRRVAELLEIEPTRLYRLGRHLHLAPGDRCIPRAVIIRAQDKDDPEMRYRVILDWLLAQLDGNRSP